MYFDSNRPIWFQVYEYIKLDIIKGIYASGEKLPTIRDLAILYGVNPNTIQKSLLELERENLILTKTTNGKFVTDDTAFINSNKYIFIKSAILNVLDYAKELGIENDEVVKIIKEEENNE